MQACMIRYEYLFTSRQMCPCKYSRVQMSETTCETENACVVVFWMNINDYIYIISITTDIEFVN